jgi:hypothetical protein
MLIPILPSFVMAEISGEVIKVRKWKSLIFRQFYFYVL